MNTNIRIQDQKRAARLVIANERNLRAQLSTERKDMRNGIQAAPSTDNRSILIERLFYAIVAHYNKQDTHEP
jgi:hypothetical protein